jgi:hypothetical protein
LERELPGVNDSALQSSRHRGSTSDLDGASEQRHYAESTREEPQIKSSQDMPFALHDRHACS